MGVTIHYRGTMNDLAQIESMEPDEPWKESLPRTPFDDANIGLLDENHPAVAQAQKFLMQVMDISHDDFNHPCYFSILSRASMDIVGGLVQATCDKLDYINHRALAITQLKRALSCHAYARGAVFGLCSNQSITPEQSSILNDQLEANLTTIHELVEQARQTLV